MDRRKEYVNKERIPGICPKCNHKDIKYKKFNFQFFDSGYYEGKCPKCKTKFREKYDLDFNGMITEEEYEND